MAGTLPEALSTEAHANEWKEMSNAGKGCMTAASLDLKNRAASRADQATNVAELAREMMAQRADRLAFVISDESRTQLTFGEIGELVDRFTAGLDALRMTEGARVLLLAPPTPQIFALV